MNLYDEFFAIIEAFEENNITYAVIGGVALAFHEQPRFTKDIDILVKDSNLEKTEETLSNLTFFKSTDPHPFLHTNLILHRFVKTERNNYLVVDLLTGSGEKIAAILNNAVKTNWDKGQVAVASKKDLIWLKKLRNSDMDKIDIKNLSSDERKN